MRVERFSSIHEIPESVWDGLLAGGHPWHTHRLLRAVEDARVENSRFWPLLFRNEDGHPVASAVLSAFTVSLDLFLGRRWQRLAAHVRRWFPRFLRIDVLFCGLPLSLGQSNLVLSEAAPAQTVIELLAGAMEQISRETNLRFLCIKELKARDLARAGALEHHGFFRGHSLPSMTLDIRWRSFDDYLASLRHSYRRRIRRSLEKIGSVRQPSLIAGGPEVVTPGRFFQLYGNVMARSETRLETLNQAFFERLWVELGRDLQIVAVVDGDTVEGAALLVKEGDTLHFMLVGLPPTPRTQHDVYFNLLYGIVDQAIGQGCRRLNLGQTAYWGKQQVGGQPEEQFLFFKAASPPLHTLLRGLRRILFPRVRLLSPRVFQ